MGNYSYSHPRWRRVQIDRFCRCEFSCLSGVFYVYIYGNYKIYIKYSFLNRTVFEKSIWERDIEHNKLRVMWVTGNVKFVRMWVSGVVG